MAGHLENVSNLPEKGVPSGCCGCGPETARFMSTPAFTWPAVSDDLYTISGIAANLWHSSRSRNF